VIGETNESTFVLSFLMKHSQGQGSCNYLTVAILLPLHSLSVHWTWLFNMKVSLFQLIIFYRTTLR